MKRLEEITENFKNVASAPLDPVVAYSIGCAVGLIPFTISRHISSRIATSSLALSNFPGPENMMGWQEVMCKDIINATGTPAGSTGKFSQSI